MKRIIVPLLVATAAATLFADDHSMVVNLNDGRTYAIHNKDIKTIKFSKNDLHDKYYVFSSDTVFLHDTLYIEKIITEYETVYVHDTIVQTKEIVLHDTITNIVTLHDTINVEVPVYIHDTIYIENPEISNMHNGHEYVDLGLPSGTLWATCNIGAKSPEEYGDYFAWGEIEPKSFYNWNNYKWCNGTKDSLTKYCINSSLGNVDNKTKLEECDDAAHIHWGGNWVIPSYANYMELSEYCDEETFILNGQKGKIMTSKINNKTIFLPCSGLYLDDFIHYTEINGSLWASTLLDMNFHDTEIWADYLGFMTTGFYASPTRQCGIPIRPVCVRKE